MVEENRKTQVRQTSSRRIVADMTLCAACRLCELVCSLHHEGVVSPALARLHIAHNPFVDEHPKFGLGKRCDLCGGEPQCVELCPVSALRYEKIA